VEKTKNHWTQRHCETVDAGLWGRRAKQFSTCGQAECHPRRTGVLSTSVFVWNSPVDVSVQQYATRNRPGSIATPALKPSIGGNRRRICIQFFAPARERHFNLANAGEANRISVKVFTPEVPSPSRATQRLRVPLRGARACARAPQTCSSSRVPSDRRKTLDSAPSREYQSPFTKACSRQVPSAGELTRDETCDRNCVMIASGKTQLGASQLRKRMPLKVDERLRRDTL
jgi:hypothetical protein